MRRDSDSTQQLYNNMQQLYNNMQQPPPSPSTSYIPTDLPSLSPLIRGCPPSPSRQAPLPACSQSPFTQPS